MQITFTSGNPCTSSILGPAPTASCDGIDVKSPVPCTKGGKGKSCVPYTTTVYFKGQAQNLTEDPEFIVDNSLVDYLIPASLGLLGLLLGGFGGYYFGKR